MLHSRCLLFVLRQALAVAVLLWSGLAAANHLAPWVEADVLLSDGAVPPADDAPWTRQSLPDEWQRSRPRMDGVVWYRFRAQLPVLPDAVQALYLPRAGDRLTVFVNGRLIGSTAEPGGAAMDTWKRPLLFAVPPDSLRAGENLVHVRLEGEADHYSGLSPAVFGAQAPLRAEYWKRFSLQTIAPVGLAAALGLLGVFFLILWSRRREDMSYVLFGAASIIWGLRNVADVLFHLAIPQPHWEIAMATLYFAFVGLLCLFCLRFVEVALPRYERLLRGAMIASPFLLYASLPWVSVLDSTRIMLLGMLAFVVPPLWVVTRLALFERSLGAFLIALAGGVAFAFGAHDWIAVGHPGMFDSIRLVPYASLFFTTAVGWLLAHRFLLTYQGLEQLNAELDHRVECKSAELMQNVARLQEAKAEADAANAAKSRFLAAASHDLRQPLQALGLSAAELGVRARSAVDIQQLAGRIGESVQALEAMFSALLDVSRLDAGSVRIERRCLALQPVFDRLQADFQPLAREKGLQLRLRPTRQWTESDPVVLERILRNLVANAVRYTERGGVLVGCRRRGRRLWVEVYDTGIGIAATERQNIFEEYYQIANPERDRGKGLGLGLSIVRRMVALLGERLRVASVPGRGSRFSLRLPCVPAEAVAPSAPAAMADFPRGRYLVALVEDDRLVRVTTESLLARHGLAVAGGADHGETRAALLVQGRAPDLIVADYRLRGSTGVAVAQALCRDYGCAIPVLLLTGEDAAERLVEVAEAGFPVLRKPVTLERLLAEIARLLPAGPAQRGPLRLVP